MADYVSTSVLCVNVIWFGLAFRLFGLQPARAVKMLVPREAKDEISRRALVDALPFLGGMNLALALLSALALYERFVHSEGPSWTTFAVSSVAHATQLAGNVPLALRGGRSGGASWDVLRGPMRTIFVVDGICAVANALVLVLGLVLG